MSLKLWAHYVLPKKIITILAGILADVTWAPIKNTLIDWFIQSYRVDMTVAREPNYQKYASFNDFFIRLLKPESRLLSSDPIVSPVDGCISQLGDIHKSELLQAKGKYYTVEKLLGSDELADAPRLDYSLFSHFMTIYLSPKDYHRVHAPQDITLTSVTYIPGRLFSVQPLTTFAVPELFARNERFIMHFESDMGPMSLVMVGATVVGKIGTSFMGELKRQKQAWTQTLETPITFNKGDELGYFKLGSTVILLWSNETNLAFKHKVGDTLQLGESLVPERGLEPPRDFSH